MNELKAYPGFAPEAKRTRRYNHELRGWLAGSAAIICAMKRGPRQKGGIQDAINDV